MKAMKSPGWILLAAFSTSLLLGCGNNETTTAGTPPKPTDSGAAATPGKKLKLVFVTNNSSDFWTIAHKGVDKAASELPNAEVDFKMPTDGTAASQQRIVDDLVAKGIDGMAISPVDPKNQKDMLNSVAKGAVLVTQDSDAPDSDRLCYIGTDNVAAGKMAGEELKKALPNGGKVMVFVGKADAQNAKERIEGLRAAIAGTKIQIIDVRTDETDRVKAKANVSDTLVKYPDIAGLVGIWSYNGPAILNATTEAGKIGKVKIVSFDEEEETLAGVKAGSIEATIVQQPFEFGYQSIKLMAAVKSGDKSGVPADKKVIVPTLVISKAQVDEFKVKLNALRGKK